MLNTQDVIANSGVSFGTSGVRGLVSDLNANVCAAFTVNFINVMRSNFSFHSVAIAIDNRPSSYAMAQACAEVLQELNITVLYYGVIPTPALAYSAMQDEIPAIMVTGSHIPFDRNGLKFYRPDGEISKEDESLIVTSSFNFNRLSSLSELPVLATATERYITRYTSLFNPDTLAGLRIGIYEHSSAGRDIYSELFSALGATVIPLGRSDNFVPIDTEAVSEEDKRLAKKWTKEHQLDALFSTDGDGDRPLLADEKGLWLRGDILGLLCARLLSIKTLAVPVSCNSAIELSGSFDKVLRTKIGSPYVIAAFEQLSTKSNSFAGFEANGGFLLGSDILLNDKVLRALPTRDAVLPAIILLAKAKVTPLSIQVSELPSRYTHSDRLQNISKEISNRLIEFGIAKPEALLVKLGLNFEKEIILNTIDGLRIDLGKYGCVHFRPSGNAPELRCYVEADSPDRASQLLSKVLLGTKMLIGEFNN
ncbi:phosphomannomutase [Pseudoalteromonas sp. JBTF-M23]|uniref:Phosphomannomutase n=1 Tax=Pseudoalteromonas caenipelagi TaxID=2726988 RepID=A0A849VJH7_9GAMM|nr:phosphomannomutase [Pseudoalteromonas caenipelagi]NOU51787.1 phosphomannomutase [Pseudoalteromonas caenipelagi]